MRTSTPRAPRRTAQVPVRTIDLFDQKRPEFYVELGYGMSTAKPLQDPCSYAVTVSGLSPIGRPAQRVKQCLAPTANETEDMVRYLKSGRAIRELKNLRAIKGDPIARLAKQHDIDALKLNLKVGNVPAAEFEALKEEQNAALISTRVSSTPLRRLHEGPQGSNVKRQRTNVHLTPNSSEANNSMLIKTPIDGDVSLDTVRSVLRLVDESLINTPERTSAATPRVLKAQPVPSPRERGPSFAYNSDAQLDKFGGLLDHRQTGLSFAFSRV